MKRAIEVEEGIPLDQVTIALSSSVNNFFYPSLLTLNGIVIFDYHLSMGCDSAYQGYKRVKVRVPGVKPLQGAKDFSPLSSVGDPFTVSQNMV